MGSADSGEFMPLIGRVKLVFNVGRTSVDEDSGGVGNGDTGEFCSANRFTTGELLKGEKDAVVVVGVRLDEFVILGARGDIGVATMGDTGIVDALAILSISCHFCT